VTTPDSTGRDRRRRDAADCLLTSLVIFCNYLLSAPRSVMLDDDGFFIMAAWFNGVSHPPGYPLYTFLAHLGTFLPFGSVAFRVHLVSALFGALACACVWKLARLLFDSRLYAYAAALAFGFSRTFWSQSIIAEVYSLNVLFLSGLLLLAVIYAREPGPGSRPGWIAFLYGLSLSNHWPLMLLSTPGLAVVLWPRRRELLGRWPALFGLALLGLTPYLWMVYRSQVSEISLFGPIENVSDFWDYLSRRAYSSVDHSVTSGWTDKLRFAGFALRETAGQFGPLSVPLLAWGAVRQAREWPGHVWIALVLVFVACTFVLVGHLQEFWRAANARMRTTKEGFFLALFEIATRQKRRYGGYLVHLGIAAMYFGFVGAAYDEDVEGALRPGQSLSVRGVEVRYDGSRMELDPAKRMVFTDMTVLQDGKPVDRIAPAKFIYEKPQGTATTEVAIRSTLGADVYAIMNSVNPETKTGTFRVIVRPFVAWIWIGGLMLIFGTAVSMSPSVTEVLGELRERTRIPRMAGAATTAAIFAIVAALLLFTLLSPMLAHAQSNSSSSLHAGSVTMHSAVEKQLFSRLLCECGGCERLPLSGCICDWAEDMRARLRDDLAAGKSPVQIQNEYRERFGAQAIAIPDDKGMDRLLWAVPVTLIAAAAVQLVRLGLRWGRTQARANAAAGVAPEGSTVSTDARYDAALERELGKLDEKA